MYVFCGFSALFQSTPPVKAATSVFCGFFRVSAEFQSTPPVKAATIWAICFSGDDSYFNPRRP